VLETLTRSDVSIVKSRVPCSDARFKKVCVLSQQSPRLRTEHVTSVGMLHEEAAPPRHSKPSIAHKQRRQAIKTDFKTKSSNSMQVRRQVASALIG
jgi:hypothetical protein